MKEDTFNQKKSKPPMAKIDPIFLMEMAKNLAFGEDKWGERGDDSHWMNGLSYESLISAAKRHILEFETGKQVDEESGTHPLINASCCLMMLHYYEQRGCYGDMDDRRFKENTVKLTAEEIMNIHAEADQ